ncbi:hypothetical protein SacmaDRAFT_4881 [Saccharomonospora marina XMU15]|uniref:Uncharacterized protein n=1 Tax=Saccharomonospora marina XMU15 TaxID=882083 RepID=H5X058_9PSEU|nr:hypothetical protein SacmaDRAFT_4881 [Saccharomonospora marina XMU15]
MACDGSRGADLGHSDWAGPGHGPTIVAHDQLSEPKRHDPRPLRGSLALAVSRVGRIARGQRNAFHDRVHFTLGLWC